MFQSISVWLKEGNKAQQTVTEKTGKRRAGGGTDIWQEAGDHTDERQTEENVLSWEKICGQKVVEMKTKERETERWED